MCNRKRVPSYWWDFAHGATGIHAVIVESDDDRFPVIRRFPVEPDQNAVAQIAAANALCDDLRAGRADPRRLAAITQGCPT